ncbi:MAG TPA: hypothetical protein VH187_16585 [Scandinavium sp.]|jgi:hypothetical protein|uniref:hypothetical protein n=1 Tax=Scandinavium sp. TaxID=2830653 RepID=UPI002E30904C|nr:hypothetical protein [Scandinavium sp.]HEX4502755.1 hypothetical protein [Scandinavium sp.]
MQNENNIDRTEKTPKFSKLKKMGKGIAVTGFYGIPTGICAYSLYLGVKTQVINLETAKLNLEAAKQAVAK